MGETSTGKSGGGSADSYIGSLISLTSKFEIRYEGILYNLNTEESSIGLRNVRSFGTEGRKKDGPQIPPSDKIYEYILFRGTDIKDLQVKLTPPLPALPPVYDDPAVIQSHYSHPASLSATMGSGGSSSAADVGSHVALTHIPQPTLESRLPMYVPGSTVGSLGSTSTLPPNASSTGLTTPMHWGASYGSLGGHPQVQQQAFPFRPPTGVTIPQTVPQQFPHPGLNASLQTSSTTLPKISNYVQPTSSSVSSTSLQFPPVIMPNHIATLPSESSQNLISDKTSLLSLSLAGSSTSLPSTSSFISSSQEITPIPTKGKPVPASTLPYQTLSQSASSIMGASPFHSETLISPNQLQSMHTGHRDVGMLMSSSSTHSSALVSSDVKAPLVLPPKPSDQKGSRVVTQFTEEFDFMAMNEKFKKDEVWGNLGKAQMRRDKAEYLEDVDNDDCLPDNEDHANCSRMENKPVYVKDDFFDSISCTALQQRPWNSPNRFSGQRKLDAETFGDFSRYHGGRGTGRRGTFRGSYYGGRGYGGWGRGNMTFSRDL